MFTSPACGRLLAKEFHSKSDFTRLLLQMFAHSTRDTHEAMRYIEIKGAESSRTLLSKPELRWAAGPGPPISGISITTATLTSMSRTDISPRRTGTILQDR